MPPLTDPQRAAVEEYAGYPHALAFSRRVHLQYHDRLELRHALYLRLIRIVQTCPPERWHPAIIGGLRLHRRDWLADPRRLRRLHLGLPPRPIAARPDDLDDREEFRVVVLERLERLTPRQRRAVELYLDCGCWSEVGRQLGIRHRQAVWRLKERVLEGLRPGVTPRAPEGARGPASERAAHR